MPITVSLDELLSSVRVTRTVSMIRTPADRISRFLGVALDSPANQVGGHHFGWDIYNTTRNLASLKAPGTGPASVAPQIVAHRTAVIPRIHEKVFLLDEKLHRRRAIGSDWGTVDERGANYITRQQAV